MNPFYSPAALMAPKRLTYTSTWIGHIPFAMALVDIIKPKRMVELGVFTGESFCAFCQSAATFSPESKCYAIDTWIGDHQAGNINEFVYRDLKEHVSLYYPSIVNLKRMSFDQALGDFDDNSIDILHIDGLHTYEAVKHDFDTWLPKLSDSGVVLFHDIAVRESDFGVWRFWDEMRSKYPNFSFDHSCGLGVLAVGPKAPSEILDLCASDTEATERLKAFYAGLGANHFHNATRFTDKLAKKWVDLLGPNQKPGQVNIELGTTLMELKEFESARREFFKATLIDKNNPTAQLNMGWALHELGFKIHSQQYFQNATQLDPEFKSHVARLHFELGNYELALKFFNQVPESVDTLISIACAQCKLGEMNLARESCAKAIKMDPDNMELQKLMEALA